MVCDIGLCQFVRRGQQDPRDVHGDVAVADDGHAFCRAQVERAVCVIRVAVVPTDELGRRMKAAQLFAGDAELLPRLTTKRVDDLVVVRSEVFDL